MDALLIEKYEIKVLVGCRSLNRDRSSSLKIGGTNVNKLDILITLIQNCVEFGPWKQNCYFNRFLNWSVGKVCVFGLFIKVGDFYLFNDQFLLFILVSVVANLKTTTNADVLHKIVGVLKCSHDKTGDASCGKIAENNE